MPTNTNEHSNDWQSVRKVIREDSFTSHYTPEDIIYRVGPNAFEFKGTNGFMITVDLSSKDFPS